MMEKLFRNVSKREDGIWHSSGPANISYPEGGNAECYAIEDYSFWFAHRNNCIAELVRKFPPDRNGAIFDTGGGDAFVAKGLAEQGQEVVLIEPGIAGAQHVKQRGLANIIETTGFSVDYATYIFSFLPLPVFMFQAIPSRVSGTRKTAKPHGNSRDHIPPHHLVQKFMDVFFRFKTGQIRSGKQIPFGGSCLISGTKH